MSANKLVFETGIDGTGFERGMHALGHSATHNLKSLVAGAFGLYSIHQILDATVEKAEELVNSAKRLGTKGVEQLQVLRQAAKEGGVEFNKVAAAFDRINVAREKALSGNSKIMAAFERLGVTKDDLRNKSSSEIFTGPIAEKAKTTNPQDLAAAGATIFGIKGFGALIPVLTSDFEELQHKMESLGSIMDTDTAVAIKTAKDEFDLLSNIIITLLAPSLVTLAETVIGLGAPLAKWINMIGSAAENRGGYFNAFTDPMMAKMLKARRERQGENSLSEDEKAWLEKFNSDAVKIVAQGNEAEKETQDKIDKLLGSIHEMAEKLKNPPKPIISGGLEGKPKPNRPKEFNADALLSVGNFLGSGSSMINSIAQQQLDVAQKQLAATQEGNEILNKMATNMDAKMDDTEIP